MLDLLLQLNDPPGTPPRRVKGGGRSVAWLDENLPASSYAGAAACRAAKRAAKCSTRDAPVGVDETCAICLDGLVDCDLGAEIGAEIGAELGAGVGVRSAGGSSCRLLACSHIFHKRCIDQWRALRYTCACACTCTYMHKHYPAHAHKQTLLRRYTCGYT